jgi:hypothetical protein
MATKPKKPEPKQQSQAGPKSARPDFLPKKKYDIPVDLIPSIKIIQSLSPERLSDDDKYISGAQEGMLFHSETRQLWDGKDGLTVVPLEVRKSYVEWIPRNQGGGFVASYATREEMEAGYKQGHEVQIVVEFLCVLPDNSVAIIRFDTPSKLGIARKFAGLIKQAETMHGARYLIGSVLKKNRAGQPYYNFTVSFKEWVQNADEYRRLEALGKNTQLPMLTGGGTGDSDKEDM